MPYALNEARQSLERFRKYGFTEAMVFFEIGMIEFLNRIKLEAPNGVYDRLTDFYARYRKAKDENEKRSVSDEFYESLPAILETLEGQSKC